MHLPTRRRPPHRTFGRARLAALVAVLGAALGAAPAAVSASAVPGSATLGSATLGRPPAPPAPPAPPVRTVDYLPGVAADLHLPARHGRAAVPLVVTIPGGGWATSDRSGLTQLAEALSAHDIAVVNATYRVGTDASHFPVPAQDVSCALDAAVALVQRAGYRVGPVILLGHSAGAHLTSLAAFGDRAFATPSCPYPHVRPDGWVGLSGVYDLRIVGQWSWAMMGGTAQELPELYAQAATETYLAPAGSHPQLKALLVQGDADEILLSTDIATGFGELLRAHGYRTDVRIIPGADHNATWKAPVILPTLLDWLRTVHSCGR